MTRLTRFGMWPTVWAACLADEWLRKKSNICVALSPSSLRRTTSTPRSSGFARLEFGVSFLLCHQNRLLRVHHPSAAGNVFDRFQIWSSRRQRRSASLSRFSRVFPPGASASFREDIHRDHPNRCIPAPEVPRRRPRPKNPPKPSRSANPGRSEPEQYPAPRPVIGPIPVGPILFPLGIFVLLIGNMSGVANIPPTLKPLPAFERLQ